MMTKLKIGLMRQVKKAKVRRLKKVKEERKEGSKEGKKGRMNVATSKSLVAQMLCGCF